MVCELVRTFGPLESALPAFSTRRLDSACSTQATDQEQASHRCFTLFDKLHASSMRWLSSWLALVQYTSVFAIFSIRQSIRRLVSVIYNDHLLKRLSRRSTIVSSDGSSFSSIVVADHLANNSPTSSLMSGRLLSKIWTSHPILMSID